MMNRSNAAWLKRWPLWVALFVLFGLLGLAAALVRFPTAVPAGPQLLPPAAIELAHPLDPLSATEIDAAREILQAERGLPEHVFFPVIVLNEPPKELLRADPPDTSLHREAFVVAYDRVANQTWEAVVDLTAKQVQSFQAVAGAQPRMLLEELEVAPKVVLADPRVQAALRLRGITDLGRVNVDLWAPGHPPVPGQPEGARMARAVFFYRDELDHDFVQPIEGLLAAVNLNTRELVQFIDTGPVPMPSPLKDVLAPVADASPRPPLKALRQVQDQGNSFEVRGHEVRWQKWRFRFAIHEREGLVLYQVGYEDGGRVRPILFRASVSEILVPYGDPDPVWGWRASFDQGEYGLGLLSTTLEKGLQVPDNAVLLDAVLPSDEGRPVTRPSCIAVYERDGGLLWQYRNYEPVMLECRRGRELVIGTLVGVGNYDYSINWVFTQDAQIKVEVALTGILRVKGVQASVCPRCAELEAAPDGKVEPRGEDRYATLVAPHLAAPNHQHLVNFRLDFDVDGSANTVSELNDAPAPASAGAFVMEETVLATEQDARRSVNPASRRRWKVFNPTVKTELGHFPGYVLEPGDNGPAYVAADSDLRRQAGFIEHHLWVTRYKPRELYAAGPYPYLGKSGDGLPAYASDNEPVRKEDVVVWYTFGLAHVPRPEEWPVMSVTRGGFRLVPDGFFTRNPALDLPGR